MKTVEKKFKEGLVLDGFQQDNGQSEENDEDFLFEEAEYLVDRIEKEYSMMEEKALEKSSLDPPTIHTCISTTCPYVNSIIDEINKALIGIKLISQKDHKGNRFVVP